MDIRTHFRLSLRDLPLRDNNPNPDCFLIYPQATGKYSTMPGGKDFISYDIPYEGEIRDRKAATESLWEIITLISQRMATMSPDCNPEFGYVDIIILEDKKIVKVLMCVKFND